MEEEIGIYSGETYNMCGSKANEAIHHNIKQVANAPTVLKAEDVSRSDFGKAMNYISEGLEHNIGVSGGGLGGQFSKGMQRLNEGIRHNVDQFGKGLHTLVHGEGDSGDSDTGGVTRRDTSAFAQSKKPRKKKKGLLALQTPSAKAARFRAGKRRFRVRPTGKTGVSTGTKSSGVSVPKG